MLGISVFYMYFLFQAFDIIWAFLEAPIKWMLQQMKKNWLIHFWLKIDTNSGGFLTCGKCFFILYSWKHINEKYTFFFKNRSHLQPHNFTDANHVDKSQHMNLQQHMMRNKEFAIEHDIPIVNQYSVAPHHSGIFLCLFLFI